MSKRTPESLKLDNLYLKLFKYAVVGLMTLALLSVVVLLPLAAYNFFQTPLPPTPAKAAPERSVNLDDLKKFLIEEERRRQEQEKSGNTPVNKQTINAPAVTQLFAEESLALYRCAEEFRSLAQLGADVSTPTEIASSNEAQRVHIERLAEHRFRGSNWVTAMVAFACGVLRNADMATLKKEKAVRTVVGPTIKFHAEVWANIESEKYEFRQAEEQRVQQEVAAENVRVALAKGRAIFMLSLAGGAVLFFFAMALYLIFAKIEANLALIHEAVVERTSPISANV